MAHAYLVRLPNDENSTVDNSPSSPHDTMAVLKLFPGYLSSTV